MLWHCESLLRWSRYPIDAPAPVSGVPVPDPRVRPELEWWENFRVALAAFPPPAADAPILAICEKLGLTAPESPYIDPDGELAQLLVAGQKAAEEKMEELVKHTGEAANSWQNSLRAFDYNNDDFEIGTIKDPVWMIPDRKTAYVARALVARAGLWGNHGYEANYQMTYVDPDNQPLSSDHRYEVHLTELPPVDAFWSLTMYDAHEFYLVANPINRYAYRRPHAGPEIWRGRLADDLHAEGFAGAGQGIKLAARAADRQLPPDHAHVSAQTAHPRRQRPAARDQARGMTRPSVGY